MAARVDQPLAVAKRPFNKAEVKGLIERALRDETGADFSFMNLGGVRDALPAGQLLVRHIWDIMPFDNEVVVGTFKGRDLPAVVARRTPGRSRPRLHAGRKRFHRRQPGPRGQPAYERV